MNAVAEVTQAWTGLETWQEPRYSPRPTLLATALTLIALLAATLTALDAWPRLPDFGSPAGDDAPVELPAAPQRDFEGEPVITYFVVASLEQAVFARQLVALAAQEQANGDHHPKASWVVRHVQSAEDAAALLSELGSVSAASAAQGGSVSLVDLR